MSPRFASISYHSDDTENAPGTARAHDARALLVIHGLVRQAGPRW